MNVMILKMHEPHGWTYANDILSKYDSFMLGAKGMTEYLGTKLIFRMQENIDFDTLQKGLNYHFTRNLDKDKLFILTGHSEEQNKTLINMLKQVEIKGKEHMLCIVICNNFPGEE